MSTPAQPPAPSPAAPPAPHESLGERVSDLFRRDGPAILKAGITEAETLARTHSAQLIRAYADLLEQYPGAEKIASSIFEVALGVAKAAGIAL
jgi:hypothetical protein